MNDEDEVSRRMEKRYSNNYLQTQHYIQLPNGLVCFCGAGKKMGLH